MKSEDEFDIPRDIEDYDQSSDEAEDEDEANIDDGLLDAVFDDLPGKYLAFPPSLEVCICI